MSYKITLVKDDNGDPEMTYVSDTTVRLFWHIKKGKDIIATPFSDLTVEGIEQTGELSASDRKKTFKDMGRSLLKEYIQKNKSVAKKEEKITTLKSAFGALGDVSSSANT